MHGRVTFKKVSIRLKSMEIQIIRKETPNVPKAEPDTTVITKFEIMDGGPIKNEFVTVRMFLKPYDLTPTYENINLMTIHYQLIMKWKLRYFGHLMQSQLIGKDPDAGKDGRREEKGATEDEMVGWHHRH